ncbi:MAG: DUF3810 domain-containing protein [Acidobacteriota bacterium]|nr:DUF3810 domain-containing protein [Acidobacteriota bacterium]MXW69986.1 DUF3810 domain-containing protein [Acidobacteriota bacterium]MYE42605.1 DUF3810 domain-containing protein [Acidobacteriota bacterium]
MGRSSPRRQRTLVLAGLGAGALGIALFQSGLSMPERVESLYTTGIYPLVVRVFSFLSGLVPFSLAELFTATAALFVIGRVTWRFTGRFRHPAASGETPTGETPTTARSSAPRAVLRRLAYTAVFALAGAGTLYAIFVVVWGLNYARPRLEHRLGLPVGQISEAELVGLTTRVAADTTRFHRLAGLPTAAVSRNPLDFADLSTAIDEAYDAIELPGDPGPGRMSPVKPAVFSGLMSRLGISGIFVPFTGEPTVNTGPPDVAVAFTAAHEKAHQRAVTHEGEASFVAYLALSRQRRHPYLSYAASFYAARHLLAAVRNADAEDRDRAWAALGPGPRRDLDALNAFWAQHRGMVRGAARRVNDSYLRTMRIPDGARSYGTVVRLLIADLRQRSAPPAAIATDGGED